MDWEQAARTTSPAVTSTLLEVTVTYGAGQSATTHTVSGTVTAGGSGVSGAIVYAFDAASSAYVGNTTTAAGGSYSLSLPGGSYKLWIQTNTQGYPDQAYGGDGTFANATVVDLTTTDQTADVVLRGGA